jgi:uncharacterized radical SAM protein YgiQ
MFLPTTKEELKTLGWDRPDVIIVTGDSYIDSPHMGTAVIGKVLLDAGFKTAIIAQPDVASGDDITRLGEPRLFWGVTGGSVDSMVANRTASGKKRKSDDYTPGGLNNRRPDRAVIAYSNLIKKHYKSNRPIVLGGIEASLRRVAHYDWWTDSIRRSVLFDAKADYIVYGMGERAAVELASALSEGRDPRAVRGLCHISKDAPSDALVLPSYENVIKDKTAFESMFKVFYQNNDPFTARSLSQRHGDRFLIQNPPQPALSMAELDSVYGLKYERELHPYYRGGGPVRALETIRFSISTHRGCYGECNFCAIAVHEGRRVAWRSQKSIVDEAAAIAGHQLFKGIIPDVGGPTANMYAIDCSRIRTKGACADRMCLTPKICPALKVDHSAQITLLDAIEKVKGVKKVVVASGLRYDMVLADKKAGGEYLRQLVGKRVSGRLRVAPEHTDERVLRLMNKPGPEILLKFREIFQRLSKEAGLKQYLSYYMIAAHPGCREADMRHLREFAVKSLGVEPEHAQIFTPTPSTYSTLMYYTERDPFTGERIFVEKSLKGRERQKDILTGPVKVVEKRWKFMLSSSGFRLKRKAGK